MTSHCLLLLTTACVVRCLQNPAIIAQKVAFAFTMDIAARWGGTVWITLYTGQQHITRQQFQYQLKYEYEFSIITQARNDGTCTRLNVRFLVFIVGTRLSALFTDEQKLTFSISFYHSWARPDATREYTYIQSRRKPGPTFWLWGHSGLAAQRIKMLKHSTDFTGCVRDSN